MHPSKANSRGPSGNGYIADTSFYDSTVFKQSYRQNDGANLWQIQSTTIILSQSFRNAWSTLLTSKVMVQLQTLGRNMQDETCWQAKDLQKSFARYMFD